jgi:hypothetical protein
MPQFAAKFYIARPPVPKRGIWHVIGILYVLVLSSTPFHQNAAKRHNSPQNAAKCCNSPQNATKRHNLL